MAGTIRYSERRMQQRFRLGGSGSAEYNPAKEVGLMIYRIALRASEEGYSVSVPGLSGCWSQGCHRGGGPGEHPAGDSGIPCGRSGAERGDRDARSRRGSVGMGKMSGINHLNAVRITGGIRILTIPGHNPVNAVTMAFRGEHYGSSL